MQQGAFDLPIRIKLLPSRWLAVTLAISHGGALIILLNVNLGLWIKLLLFVAVVLSFLHSFHVYIWQKSSYSIIELILNDRDEWLLIRRNGQVMEPTLRSEAFVHPMLVVLPFRQGYHFATIVLTPDTVDKETLRRLRVRLRFKRQ